MNTDEHGYGNGDGENFVTATAFATEITEDGKGNGVKFCPPLLLHFWRYTASTIGLISERSEKAEGETNRFRSSLPFN
jgi:hypothetical protein